MKTNDKHKKNLVSEILRRVASKIGAQVVLDPEYGFAGQITYQSGIRRYFRASSLDLNHLGASEIARDKDYANYFIERMGYPIIEGKTFFSDEFAEIIRSKRDINAGYQYALSLGLPVFVKPNSKSQGEGVVKVRTKREFYKAMREAFKIDRVVIVQRVVKGKDYRIVVLDNRAISAYERIPLYITGNGHSSIRALLEEKQASFDRTERDTRIKINDYRIKLILQRKKLTLDSVVPKAEHLQLLDNANLSSGGDSIDVTEVVHPDFKKIAIDLTRDMGLRLCGVDLMIDGDIKSPAGKYWIIEINSAPGLDNYAAIGPSQAKIVEDLYLKVLKAME